MLRMSEVNEVDHQAMQHMLTEGRVDWQGFGQQIALETDALLGGPEAVLLFDESGFAKKGEASAGVARQWNGRLGKVDNCQVGVFAALCRDGMASLIDTRLYLPERWTNDVARCERAAIPEDAQQYQSKTQLALAMLKVAQQRGVRFGYVGIDGGYGKEPAFLRGVDGLGCRFVADVHCDQTLYLEDPDPKVPLPTGRGRVPIHRKPQCPGLRVDRWAAARSMVSAHLARGRKRPVGCRLPARPHLGLGRRGRTCPLLASSGAQGSRCGRRFPLWLVQRATANAMAGTREGSGPTVFH